MAAGPTPSDDPAGSGAAARGRLVALAVLLGVGAVLVVVALLAGGSGESGSERSSLRVERSPAPDGIELLVYVEAADNRAEVAGGESRVSVECEDEGGRVVAQGDHPWPFTDTDGGTTDPHVHQPVPDAAAGSVTRCRLSGTDPELQGRVADGSLR
jgi:hypothetical protein